MVIRYGMKKKKKNRKGKYVKSGLKNILNKFNNELSVRAEMSPVLPSLATESQERFEHLQMGGLSE